MIRVSEEAKAVLGASPAPEGEVLRLTLRPPGAGRPGGLAFDHGPGEGADQVVQHAGRQVLRIDVSVRKGFDGASVEVVDGAVVVVPPEGPPADGDARGDVLRPPGPRVAALRRSRTEGAPSGPADEPSGAPPLRAQG